MNTNTRANTRQRFATLTEQQIALLKPNATFHVMWALLMHAQGTGRCWPKMATIMHETGLSRSTVYDAVAKLIELGMITRTADHRVFFISDMSTVPESQTEVRKAGRQNLGSRNAFLIEENQRKDEDPMTVKITNLHRAGAAVGKSPSNMTNIADAPSKRPATLASTPRACLEHILKLSGVEITDAYKFDDSRTLAEWIVLIDEAWALRDTVLRNPEYPEFNAGKVTIYAKYRAKYRSKVSTVQRASTGSYTTESDILTALAQTDEETRRNMLCNIVVHGVSRADLQGRVSESDIAYLFPSASDSTAS